MERSYADAANNHGFKRSRWRGLEKVTIQDLMIAAIQNIRILVKHWRRPTGVAQEMQMVEQTAAFISGFLYESAHFAMSFWHTLLFAPYFGYHKAQV